MRKSISVCVIVWLALLSGCLTMPTDRMGESMAVAEYSPPVPETAAAATGRAAGTDAGQKISMQKLMTLSPGDTYKQIDHHRLFSLTLQDAELRNVLAMLSTESGVPIVAGQEVAGKVTIAIKDRTLGDALYAVLEPLGLTAYVDNGIIMVKKPGLISRTFQLSYITDKRTSTSTTNASVSATSGSTYSTTSTSGTSGSGSQGNVSVSTTGTTDFWQEIKEGLEAVIFGSGGKDAKGPKQLVINEMAGIIYVTDYADNMAKVADYLNEVERAVKRQVLIQAHIVEVTLDDEFAMGVDWEYLFSKRSFDLGLSQAVLPVPNSEVFQLTWDSGSGDLKKLVIDAMQDLGQVNMLSSPKVSTLNNQKAVIKLTTKEVTWITETIFYDNGGTSQTTINPQIDEVGLFLDVTPSINASGRITLQIHPSISEILEISESPGGGTIPQSSKPVINVREVDTIADVKAGQTVVIAGLISDRFSSSRKSVPGLGELPVVGNLFSHVEQKKSKVELVIFLTPYVLDDQTIDRIRMEHEERLDRTAEINSLLEPTVRFFGK